MRLRNMLRICLVFWESEPQYAYKRYAYKKHVYDWVFAEESMFDSRPLNKCPNNSIQALCPLPLHILMWSSYVISFLFPNIHY